MIDEENLSKGNMRKLRALRKSIGNELADEAFIKWLSAQTADAADKEDAVSVELLEAVAPVVEKLNLGRYGYTIRRSRAGLTATRNTSLQD